MQKEIFKRSSSLFFIVIGLMIISLLLIWLSNPEILKREQADESVVTVYSCGEPVTFESVPQRAMAMDTNMVEMMLALGLEDHMVGYWISGVEVGEEFQD